MIKRTDLSDTEILQTFEPVYLAAEDKKPKPGTEPVIRFDILAKQVSVI
jgi:hypothetical protein